MPPSRRAYNPPRQDRHRRLGAPDRSSPRAIHDLDGARDGRCTVASAVRHVVAHRIGGHVLDRVAALGATGAHAGPTRSGPLTDVIPREAAEEQRPALTQVRAKQGATEFLHPIGTGSFTLGTDPANALVIHDRFISSRHLQVTRTEAGFHVRDLNSTNGTYLDAVRVFEVELPLNAVLRVGARLRRGGHLDHRVLQLEAA
jgi:FHA domain-containing protein